MAKNCSSLSLSCFLIKLIYFLFVVWGEGGGGSHSYENIIERTTSSEIFQAIFPL